ncbi:MAG: hypothetical protein K8T89_16200 [Planctomycetes bacterium]|nr:hypothetical protein [Planctomycetota bacterium]
MDRILIPESDLEMLSEELRNRFLSENDRLGYVNDINDPCYGKPFCWYLLFEHWSDLVKRSFPDVRESTLFYNKYYWFQRYSHLWMNQHGKDAGLEQQGFRLIEMADAIDGVDWTLVELLEQEAIKIANLVQRREGDKENTSR